MLILPLSLILLQYCQCISINSSNTDNYINKGINKQWEFCHVDTTKAKDFSLFEQFPGVTVAFFV